MSCLCPALHWSGCPGLEPATIRNKMQCKRLIVLCTDCILTWTYFEKIFSTVILYILVWLPGNSDWSSVDLCNGSLTTVWWPVVSYSASSGWIYFCTSHLCVRLVCTDLEHLEDISCSGALMSLMFIQGLCNTGHKRQMLTLDLKY